MRGFKSLFAWISFFSFLFLFCSCSRASVTPSTAMGELLASHSLPSGVVYTSELGGDKMLTELLGASELEGVESFALYLSARGKVCEVAVFACYSKGEARELAELCAKRGAFLSRHESGVSSKILVKGSYLLWAASDDPNTLISTLSQAVN